MKFAAEHDVIILGAGPAGTSAAIRLADMGLDVAIAERHRFPRGHVGICISDTTVALIHYVGLGIEFDDARFWRRGVTAVRWGASETMLVPQPGYHVDRAVLDGLMLAKARAAGVKVYQPVRVKEMDRLEDSSWRVTIASGEQHQILKTRFIVDAAGRRSAVRSTRIKDGPPLLALHAEWILHARPDFDGLIEAGEDAWLWYAQTACDRAVVSVFCDPRRLRAAKKDGVQVAYSGLLRQFRALNPELLGEPGSEPRACDATSHHAADPIGDRYIRLGDACFSVDPLSSQGVHLALQSGLQGAIVVNTVLKKPQNADAAQRFFQARIAERVSRYSHSALHEYARVAATCANAFWQERARDAAAAKASATLFAAELRPPSGRIAISPDTRFDTAPVIDGRFVEIRGVVRHPGFDGDVAYVEGADLVRLLHALPSSFAYGDIPQIWQATVPADTGRRIASWLWSRHVLVQAR